jgi:protein-S-isoprenylcysteine O-methyltransferase Ste14
MVIPPPLVALGAAVVQRALTAHAPRPGPVRAGIAGAVALCSMTLAGASARQFGLSGTTVEPFDPSKASILVTTGANAISRNPMYVGLAGVLVAHAIARGAWSALVPVAAFVAVIDRFQIEAEEPALLANFGAEYEAYRASTPRWLDRRSLSAGLGR